VRRPALLAVGGAGALIVLALAGGYAYFFTGLRSAPKPLSLAGSSPAPGAGSSASGLAGTWSVSSGSVARYRVNELFAGTASNHQAVAETPDLSGSLSVQSPSGSDELSDLKITAHLTSLHSIDSVAGYNVASRDRIVQQSLATAQYPDAIFAAKNVQLPAGLGAASVADVTVPGQLTIHGVTKTEQVSLKQIQLSGTTADVVGQTTFNMTDFGIQPPTLPITAVQPQVTLEFELKLTKT
jgi:polyisoprenoid-binding protein YceI